MSELPSGAITFLFTDIEGSTRLLKQLRERYGDVLAEHQRLLREAFAAHGGREVDTQGDSFFVAFASAREALLAAVEAQLALAAHPWPDGVQVKVRMGLHTGQARATDGRYTGLAVHRAARICAAGHGGQILVSQATQTLLEDEEEDMHVFLRDLGEQRLKDLDRPVRLYQAGADGLPSSFPPPRGEAPLADAAEVALAPPRWRRRPVLAAGALGLAAVLVAAVFLTRDSRGGLGGVQPNHVGIIDVNSNEIVAEVPVGIRPGPIAVGRGAVWVGNLEDRSLTRIDAGRRSPAANVPLEQQTPTGLAVDAAGAVWVAHGFLGALSRVDPDFNQAAEPLDVAGRSEHGSVAVADGSVWAVYGESTMARVDPGGARVVASGFAGAAQAALTAGAGALWVANSGDATVDRFNPSTFEEGPVRTVNVGRQPSAIAFGAGAVWVANEGDDTVWRIDPNAGSAEIIRVDDRPTAIAVADGAVWVASSGARTVTRIDPRTREPVATMEIGSVPAGLAAGDGIVWVTAQEP